MAALITDSSPLTATQALTSTVQVIASGNFAGNTVLIEVSADSLDYAPLYVFRSPGWKFFDTKTGTTLRATVVGGFAGSTVDVSVI